MAWSYRSLIIEAEPAFAKKLEDRATMVALYFVYYLGRVHQTLRGTPAVEAGIGSRKSLCSNSFMRSRYT